MSKIEVSKEEEFIEQEETINGYVIRLSFDSSKYEKIRNLKLNFKGPNHGILTHIGNAFKRKKIVHHEYMEIEQVIHIQETSGNKKLNLLTKNTVTDLLNKLSKKEIKCNIFILQEYGSFVNQLFKKELIVLLLLIYLTKDLQMRLIEIWE